jgi:hypothetical protein
VPERFLTQDYRISQTDLYNYQIAFPLDYSNARELIIFLKKVSHDWDFYYGEKEIHFNKFVVSPDPPGKGPMFIVSSNHNKSGNGVYFYYSNIDNQSTIRLYNKRIIDDMIEMLSQGLQ